MHYGPSDNKILEAYWLVLSCIWTTDHNGSFIAESDHKMVFISMYFSYLVITSSTTVELNNTSDFRAFTSPNWPSNYPNYAYQRFTIYSPVGTIVKLEVLDLQLQGSCSYDTVTVYDGRYWYHSYILHSFLSFPHFRENNGYILLFALQKWENELIHIFVTWFCEKIHGHHFFTIRRRHICSWTG